ncbi:MAG: stage V sporulation protein AD [Bacillaceae bacterium]|jgi:stage V sporulation protein AD|uniref:Stage V sporulation protein AD n=1 Tax=Aeribacillus pallidus TaxID=33936 RepID=A0A161XZG0_9BACI|nr:MULTISPECIES: stage V sporulation protein AD [Aeribacillus]AXI39638.1 stage V sporulation protein AD [Bacillaceae bacterium ZC4]REJ13245.1 MAG: stage V sporulation protein AD [Bacillaceae bacterium]ASS91050.1 stage V sporulation protein AD [Aeribacillus pallidus]KZN94702.1 stage V sporulation protein AD [Aeribacillus pallidus]MDR9793483.1 stage V sporulation protein AD [Aeribacillus pallidus]
MLKGHRTWVFHNQPVIISTATVGGPFEANGRLADDFDLLHEDLWLGEDSYEKAHKVLFEEAFYKAIEKGNIEKEQVEFIISGDLVNQITPSSFAARTFGVPYLGIFGACSTSMEGLALSAFIVNYGGAKYLLTGAASHNTAIEKQFRYPTEYGGQKPPTAQWTVTGAGAALLSNEGKGPAVTSATIGRVVDLGMSDPFNMGGAMAPAAVDTIEAHFRDLNIDADYYDLIVTGDLGKIGRNVALELFEKNGVQMDEEKFQDCGLMIYREGQPVLSGASGAGCSAIVVYGHLLNRMKKGELKRILAVATGALLSPLTFQQNETIPCIAHAVSIEFRG